MTDSHDISIIDAHHHLWDLDHHRYPWLDPGTPSIVGDTAQIRRNYGPDEYRADAAMFNVAGTVHLDGGFYPLDPVGETRLVQSFHDRFGFPNAIVGAVRLDAEDLDETIRAHLDASPLLRGVRHIVAWHEIGRLSYVDRSDWLADERWVAGYRSLADHGLSGDMQIYPSQMAAAAELASDTPGIPMILNQAGMPDGLVTGDFAPWRRGIRRLAENPNVGIKISGFGMLKPDWTLADLRPLVDDILDAFGTDRVMFGSNFPVDKLFGSFERVFAAYFAATEALADAERDKLFSGNARRLYRMDAMPSPETRQD